MLKLNVTPDLTTLQHKRVTVGGKLTYPFVQGASVLPSDH